MNQITLKAARINANLKQQEVANHLSVNIATVSSWETGKNMPSLKNFRKLCDLYNCALEEIKFE